MSNTNNEQQKELPSFKGFTNKDCKFYPCHKNVGKGVAFNCLYCYCPLYFVNCPGPYKVITDKNGFKRKDCTNCVLPHAGYDKSWKFTQKWLSVPIPWATRPQNKEHIQIYSDMVESHFEEVSLD